MWMINYMIGTQQHQTELFHVHIYYVVLFYWQILTKPLFQEPFNPRLKNKKGRFRIIS
jgi:hypothetical protein